MSLRNVLVIAGKEFRDVLRDRRTLVFMLLLPIAVMPVLMVGVSRFAKTQLKAKEKRVLVIAADPLDRNLLIGLTRRWFNENLGMLGGLALRLGVDRVGGFDDLGRLAARVETLKTRAPGGEALAAAWIKAASEFSEQQRQLLDDAGAISRLMSLVKWAELPRETDATAPLPQGVALPAELPEGLSGAALARAISGAGKEVHAAIELPLDAWETVAQGDVSVPVTIVYDSSQSLSKEAYDRLVGALEALGRLELRQRLVAEQLGPGFPRPFDVRVANLASDSRKVQAILGALLPYLIILFCFFGAFYPSLDVTAGEKERFTLETLLLAPISRLEIAAGKFVVVFSAAVTAAVLATASLAFTFTHGVLPEGLLSAFELDFQPLALALTASLLLPVAALFSALLLGVALLARSFKEAQSYTAPLQFLVLLPAMSALLPDLETELHWAWVPLMNVSMLMKELLKGNYLWDFYAITQGSMLVLTALVLWGAGRLFRRESVLLRS